MNAKQTTPIIATLAPAIATVAPPLLLIGGAAFFVWLLFGGDEKKPENEPEDFAPSRPPSSSPPNSGGNSVENRGTPANSGGKTSLTPAPSVPVSAPILASSIPAAPKIPVPPTVAAAKIQPEIPLPAQKRIISREDMAKIFNGGSRLTRKSAVAVLKALGFGKTAAYEALATNGRFHLGCNLRRTE